MQNKRWTILFVCNKHAFIYMPNQFRYFYERNDPSSFEVLIISNYDRDDDIKQLVKSYDEKYHNCRVLNFKVAENIEITEDNFTEHEEVDQHGESLNFGIKNVQTPYVVVQDPDFFWLQRDILEFFQSKMDEGYRFIGAPYPRKVGLGAPDFPTLYATVARSEDLKSVDLRGTYNDPVLRQQLQQLFPQSEWSFSGDVGFRIRKNFSDSKFLSFKYKQEDDLVCRMGFYSQAETGGFYFEGESIGIHLFGGCRNAKNSIYNLKLTDAQRADLDDYWQVQREKYSNYFLSLSEEPKLMPPEKVWTIVFVNYKTSYYLKWQLKCLFDYNDPSEFDFIIVDNSAPSETDELYRICSSYLKYGNIKIIPYTPVDKAASGQHGEGLTEALKYVNSKYFLANDPDFFWIKKGHLKWLEYLLNNGPISVGSPYVGKVGNGAPEFPCAWGSAYRTEDIKYLDFTAISCPEKVLESISRYPNRDYSFDVGWKIRLALSLAMDPDTGKLTDKKNYLAFECLSTKNTHALFGAHSYDCCTIDCLLGDEVVAQHLFRGSFTSAPDGNKDLNLPLSNDLLKIRDGIGKYFYEIYSGGTEFENLKLIWKMYFRLYLLIPLISFEKKYNCYIMYFLGIRSKFKIKTNKKPSMKACFPPKTIFELVINNLKLCEVIKGKHISLYVLNKRVF